MPTGTLHVRLNGARYLKTTVIVPGTNLKLLRKTDLYCLLYVDVRFRLKSTVLKNAGGAPEWNQDFQLSVTESLNQLCVDIFDENTLADTPMGNVVIDLKEIFYGGYTVERWFPVQNAKQGSVIHMSMWFNHGHVNQSVAYPTAPTTPEKSNTVPYLLGGLAAGGVASVLGSALYGLATNKPNGHTHQSNEQQPQQHYQPAPPVAPAECYHPPSVPSYTQPWIVCHPYATGEQVSFENEVYTCVIAHTSQDDWKPTRATTLWNRA